jgi:hypothetical protein
MAGGHESFGVAETLRFPVLPARREVKRLVQRYAF